MSDNEQQVSPVEKKITVSPVKKEKDPKRVAQGKRLAQISKAAKEKKMRERIESEGKVDFSVDYKSTLYVLGSSIFVFAGAYLYFSQGRQIAPLETKNTENEQAPQRKFISLFD